MSELELLEFIQDLIEHRSDLSVSTSLDRDCEELSVTTCAGAVFDISAMKARDERVKP